MNIDAAVGATTGNAVKTGIGLKIPDNALPIGAGVVDYGIIFAAVTMSPLQAMIDFGLLGTHLGLDRYGPHDIETSMFLWDPLNYDPAKKQRVHEIYAPAIAESRYANAALHIMAVPAFVLGLALYPIEKAAEYLPFAAEKINKRYGNNGLYKTLTGAVDFVNRLTAFPTEASEVPAEKEKAYAAGQLNPPASLQNLLNEGELP